MKYLLTEEELFALKNREALTRKELFEELMDFLTGPISANMTAARYEHDFRSTTRENFVITFTNLKRIIEEARKKFVDDHTTK